MGLDEDSYEDCDEYYEDSPSSTMNLSPGEDRTLYRIFIILHSVCTTFPSERIRFSESLGLSKILREAKQARDRGDSKRNV